MWGAAPRHSRLLAAIIGLAAILLAAPASGGAESTAAAATITSVSPTSGPVGSTVTITGTNFVNVSQVTFYDYPSPSFTVNSSTSITAVVPYGTPSPGRWRVITAAGTAVYDPTFTVTGTPAIAGVSPTSGAVGSVVTITGSNFANVTGVTFYDYPSPSWKLTSPTSITAVVPAGTPSPGRWRVINPAYTAVSSATFAVSGTPTITSISPMSAPAGSKVTISGSNFVNVTGVTFYDAPSPSFTVASPTSITATVPSGTPSPGRWRVINPAYTAVFDPLFSVGGDVTAPSAPTGLSVTGATPNSITLGWSASTDNVGVSAYNVYRGGSVAGTSAATSFTVGSLSCATTYSFTVQAKDAAGNLSPQSASISGSTSACPSPPASPPPPASHPPGGGWLIRSVDDGASTYTGSRNDDPIVFPNQPGASHLHDFFCNAQTTASSTYLQMVGASTVCPSGDAAGYWAPALYRNGVKINPAGSGIREQIYYRANNITAAVRVTPFPADFMMIVGDSHATSLDDANAVNAGSGLGSKIGTELYWGCSDNSESGKPTTPINCSTGIITVHLGFPNCWNGVKVTGDQIKAGTMRWPSSGSCPPDFPITLPRIIERFEYPVGTDSSGVTLSSGPTYTLHADFWNTWKQSSLQYLVDNCLNAAVDCGTNPAVP
jgi:Domain of unknown function (DUF1996)/IPT/TIG domain/Fibronectin type III domain